MLSTKVFNQLTGNLLSPEFKIILYTVFVVSLFFIKNLSLYLFLFFALSLFLMRIPFRKITAGWIPISLFLAFTFISNMLFQPGRILYKAGPVFITEEGLTAAATRAARVFFMIFGAKMLTSTTDIEALAGAMGKILKPLERLGVPIKEFFSTMGLAMKSLPVLKEQIMNSYKEKIRDDKISGFGNRVKVVIAFLIPLFLKTMQKPEKYFINEKKD